MRKFFVVALLLAGCQDGPPRASGHLNLRWVDDTSLGVRCYAFVERQGIMCVKLSAAK